jgi:hypothetical protein
MLCPPQKKGQNGALDPGVEAYETEGVALKQGGDKGDGKWQQRYFVLKDYKLEYYKEKPKIGDKSVPKNIVPITARTSIKMAADFVSRQLGRHMTPESQ